MVYITFILFKNVPFGPMRNLLFLGYIIMQNIARTCLRNVEILYFISSEKQKHGSGCITSLVYLLLMVCKKQDFLHD